MFQRMPSTSNFPSASKRFPPDLPILGDLNDEQREAVLAPPGPMLVLAGAGTGKTRVIACRIAALLESDPSLRPKNILALTFSRKAAQQMLKRVEGLRGTYADELGVFTFHGFCHRFLQDHALECGLPERFRLLDPVDGWIFFRSLLPRMGLRYAWNLSDPTACIDGFLRFIGRAKDERVGPEEYSAYARRLEQTDARGRSEEIARAYRLYQEAMRRAGQLDFGDLIVETVRILQERLALLQQVRRRYRALLVDEFQDANVAQIDLLKQLAGPEPNLCVVGDDDQAIYRFRGASFASFLLIRQAYPMSRVVRLTQNYRSTPSILSVSDRLIRHNEPDRYDSQKKLWTSASEGPPVEVWVCQDEEHEAEQAAALLRRLRETQPADERRWSRMAVLYRAHAHRRALVPLLKQAGIPFGVRGGYALFEQPEIRDLLAFLQILQDPSASIPLFRLLSHPVFGIPTADLLGLSRWAWEKGVPLREVVESLPVGEEWSPATRKALERIRADWAELQSRGVQDVEGLVLKIAGESFLQVLFRMPEGPTADPPVALEGLLRWVRRFVRTQPEPNDLSSFLRYVDGVLKAGVLESLPEEEETGLEDRVSLMTVHQAKGLEFDWVILLGLVQGQFPSRNRPESIPFPIDLMKERLPQGDYHLQEERRLCYVACTRARKGLFLLTQDRLRKRPSIFLRQMSGKGSVATIRTQPAPGSPVPRPARAVSPVFSADPVWPIGERFSHTQLQMHKTCPLKYLYAYVYRIPFRATPQMLFGTDLHECLERFYQQLCRGISPVLEELLDSFRQLHVSGRYGEPHEDEEYLRWGERILTAYYRKQEGHWVLPLGVEKEFCLELEEVSVKGVIDRIDPLPGGGVQIIDYKSGGPKEKANFEEQLQLWLYALAARDVLHLDPRKATFYYLRTNSELSFDPTPEVLERTRERILSMAREIRTGHFTPKPSVAVCGRCDYRNLCPSSAV